MPVALFGITNDSLNLAVNLVVLFLVVVYIALIVWTYMDARRRLEDPVLVGAATVASFFPFVGPLVYSIVRPPEFLDDKKERELEIRSAELRVRQLEEASCPNCSFPIERSYLRCPSCKARVKDPCEACGKPIDPRWSLCPYCETAVRRSAPPAAPKRRGAKKAAAKAPAGAPPSSEQRRRKQPSEAARRVTSESERAPAPTRQSAERSARPAQAPSATAKRASASEVKAPSKPPAKASSTAPAPAEGDERPATT